MFISAVGEMGFRLKFSPGFAILLQIHPLTEEVRNRRRSSLWAGKAQKEYGNIRYFAEQFKP